MAAKIRERTPDSILWNLPRNADRRKSNMQEMLSESKDANSGEFDEQCKHKVINFMPGQNDNIDKGGTFKAWRLSMNIQAGTTMHRCYGVDTISERHRHRYEFNNDYREQITLSGLTVSGTSPDGRLVETVEITDRPFHVGVQYHPEFKSRPNRPHPLFKGFIQAALSHQSGGNL